jgi:hypothetical protein
MTISQLLQLQELADSGATLSDDQQYQLFWGEARELSTLTDRELVAYWNVIQMSARCVGGKGGKNERHGKIVQGLLNGRGIKARPGKQLKAAA